MGVGSGFDKLQTRRMMVRTPLSSNCKGTATAGTDQAQSSGVI